MRRGLAETGRDQGDKLKHVKGGEDPHNTQFQSVLRNLSPFQPYKFKSIQF